MGLANKNVNGFSEKSLFFFLSTVLGEPFNRNGWLDETIKRSNLHFFFFFPSAQCTDNDYFDRCVATYIVHTCVSCTRDTIAAVILFQPLTTKTIIIIIK